MHDAMIEEFKIEVRLADRAKADDGHLASYPELPERDIEMLHWAVEGSFRLIAGDRPLTITSYGTDGNIDEYLWSQLMGWHTKFPKLLAGEVIEQDIFDNPGATRVLPQNDEVKVVFMRPSKEGTTTSETTVSVARFGSALIEATDSLIDDLVNLNPELANSDIVKELDGANINTKQLLQEHKQN